MQQYGNSGETKGFAFSSDRNVATEGKLEDGCQKRETETETETEARGQMQDERRRRRIEVRGGMRDGDGG